MNTLAEYYKIKGMSSAQEIGEYLGNSLDISTAEKFCNSFFSYYFILKIIAKEENDALWDDYEKKMARHNATKVDGEKDKCRSQSSDSSNLDADSRREARIIPLNPEVLSPV